MLIWAKLAVAVLLLFTMFSCLQSITIVTLSNTAMQIRLVVTGALSLTSWRPTNGLSVQQGIAVMRQMLMELTLAVTVADNVMWMSFKTHHQTPLAQELAIRLTRICFSQLSRPIMRRMDSLMGTQQNWCRMIALLNLSKTSVLTWILWQAIWPIWCSFSATGVVRDSIGFSTECVTEIAAWAVRYLPSATWKFGQEATSLILILLRNLNPSQLQLTQLILSKYSITLIAADRAFKKAFAPQTVTVLCHGHQTTTANVDRQTPPVVASPSKWHLKLTPTSKSAEKTFGALAKAVTTADSAGRHLTLLSGSLQKRCAVVRLFNQA